MRIVRSRPQSNFTVFPNALLRDRALSLRARGLLVTLLSYPDGWVTSSTRLADEVKEGRDAIRAALGELQTAGYLTSTRRQDAKGRWRTEQMVTDTPDRPVTSARPPDGSLF